MLEKNIKDRDANIELLEDRCKKWKFIWVIFFITGWSLVWFSVILLPSNIDYLGIGTGICFLIFATWFLIGYFYYCLIIIFREVTK
jgi:hypothetical protein